MDLRLRARFWLESVIALIGTALALLTIVHRDWIESVFGVDPDQHNGAVEWMIVFAALAVAVASVTLARREWQRRLAAA